MAFYNAVFDMTYQRVWCHIMDNVVKTYESWCTDINTRRAWPKTDWESDDMAFDKWASLYDAQPV